MGLTFKDAYFVELQKLPQGSNQVWLVVKKTAICLILNMSSFKNKIQVSV